MPGILFQKRFGRLLAAAALGAGEGAAEGPAAGESDIVLD